MSTMENGVSVIIIFLEIMFMLKFTHVCQFLQGRRVQEPNNDRLAQTGFRHFYELLLVLYHGLCVVYKAGS